MDRQERFQVLGKLGEGGMGAVFRARDASTGQVVALKRLAPDSEKEALLNFQREYHTLASLQHPNIIRAFEYGVEKDSAFYSMPILEGEEVSGDEILPIDRICSILRDVASALAYLHARRFIHRDVTRRNVRIDSHDRAVLIDFGILSTAGAAAAVAGTPPYVPPEALRGLPLDHRVDLYSLGALAYRLITGKHAYPARRLQDLYRVWARPPRAPTEIRPETPRRLNDLVLSLLALDRLARPSSAAEVIDSEPSRPCHPCRRARCRGAIWPARP